MIKRLVKKYLSRNYKKQGFFDGYGMLWFNSAIEEYKASDLPSSKKKWALKRGFYPFRIEQYGLTDENYKEFLSDKEYKRLYPINNIYRRWIDDKLTMKYVLKPFDEYMPRYYYHLIKERTCHVMKLMDCPDECAAEYEGILKLLRDVGVLAVKPTGGTYGIGFCKLEYKNKKYVVNGEAKTKEEMISFLKNLRDHIIIEYVRMHEKIASLNPTSLNTIRVMLINENGNNPIIASSFMRIGTVASGIVDNSAQGGMFCKVDVDSGRFYDGEKNIDHVVTPSPVHPDTGVPIEGTIPHWETVKTKLIEISKYIPQLEWMGFDVAITETGFNIIEINSHQGLHRYHTYPQEIKDYFKRKSQLKNK
ncbi:MAG: hypothetical protein IKT39_05310 [Clostridia bacterium]|nr:hypothetical protein [Clostridia bacterium]